MQPVRVKEQIACDGVRNVWNQSNGRLEQRTPTLASASVDGALHYKENGHVVHVTRVRVRARPVQRQRQVPVTHVDSEGILRNLIRNAYTIRLKSYRTS